MAAPSWLKAARPAAGANGKLRIRTLYALHAPVQDRPDWPNKGFDFRPVMEKYNTELAGRFPGITFVPTLATGPAQAQ